MSNDVIQMKFNTVTRLTASWCGPCKSYAPIFEEVTDGFVDDWKIVTLDVDTEEGKEFAMKHGTRSVPTTVIEHRGQEAVVVPGALDKTKLEFLLTK
jgi:thioredoxin-like negative regulator of GroEL